MPTIHVQLIITLYLKASQVSGEPYTYVAVDSKYFTRSFTMIQHPFEMQFELGVVIMS